MLATLRGLVRAGIAIISISVFVGFVALRSLILGYDLKFSLRARKKFTRFLMWVFGIKLTKKGKVPEGTFIYIGNHRSYMDPMISLCHVEAVPVAKAELSGWPLIGYGAKITGILFVKRESKTSRGYTMERMRDYLRRGFSVLIYPEGTTHVQHKTIAFQKGAFSLAIKENIPIVPMALIFEDINDAWVGTEKFAPHFFRTYGKPNRKITIHYGEPITANDATELSQKTKAWLDQKLLEAV